MESTSDHYKEEFCQLAFREKYMVAKNSILEALDTESSSASWVIAVSSVIPYSRLHSFQQPQVCAG